MLEPCDPHKWAHTEDLDTEGGGALFLGLDETECPGAPDDGALFVDARVCVRCGLVEPLLHEPATSLAALRRVFALGPAACDRCATQMLALGDRVEGHGGGSLHIPLDRRWTLGLEAHACPECARLSFSVARGERKPEAPLHATLLTDHPAAGAACLRCGHGDVRALYVEAYHCGRLLVSIPSTAEGQGPHYVRAHVCVACEGLRLFAERDPEASRPGPDSGRNNADELDRPTGGAATGHDRRVSIGVNG